MCWPLWYDRVLQCAVMCCNVLQYTGLFDVTVSAPKCHPFYIQRYQNLDLLVSHSINLMLVQSEFFPPRHPSFLFKDSNLDFGLIWIWILFVWFKDGEALDNLHLIVPATSKEPSQSRFQQARDRGLLFGDVHWQLLVVHWQFSCICSASCLELVLTKILFNTLLE